MLADHERRLMLTRTRNRGVSMIEIMIALAVLAILTSLALPSFNGFIANQRIRAAAESLRSGVQLARVEALRRGTGVVFDMSGLDSSWAIGCESPVGDDLDGDGLPDCPAQIQSAERAVSGGAAVMSITADSTRLTFSPVGLVRQANLDGSAPLTRVDISALNVSEQKPLRILVPAGGLSRICDPAVTTVGDTRKC